MRDRGDGNGGWGKEPQPTILFFCDVNVAAGGHVDFKSTHYYSQRFNDMMLDVKFFRDILEDFATPSCCDSDIKRLAKYRVIPPGFPNSTAQQPRQTRQKGAYQ